jgi:hypothetical protein
MRRRSGRFRKLPSNNGCVKRSRSWTDIGELQKPIRDLEKRRWDTSTKLREL